MGKNGLNISIDAAQIASEFKELAMEVEQDLTKGIERLAALTHAKVLEEAQEELSSATFMTYKEQLSIIELEPGIWVVTLDQPAMWIEEGIDPNFDMKPGLLKNGKTGKNGRYNIIPFKHNQAPSRMTPKAQELATQIKQEFAKHFEPINKERKREGQETISWGKVELNDNGSPRTGKLHELNFGGEIPGKGNTPAMEGVTVYQTQNPKNNSVRRDIFTFRTVTDKQIGKWLHPGYGKKQFFEKAYEWSLKQWDDEILPEIFKKWE